MKKSGITDLKSRKHRSHWRVSRRFRFQTGNSYLKSFTPNFIVPSESQFKMSLASLVEHFTGKETSVMNKTKHQRIRETLYENTFKL